MKTNATSDAKDKETRFKDLLRQHNTMLYKVCFLYHSADAPVDDLYQETVANIWNGMDSFDVRADITTWLYRTAINSCISWHRRVSRHRGTVDLDHALEVLADDDSERAENLRVLYRMISRLDPLEKALITLWLDERDYKEIADITGLGLCQNRRSPIFKPVVKHKTKPQLSQAGALSYQKVLLTL